MRRLDRLHLRDASGINDNEQLEEVKELEIQSWTFGRDAPRLFNTDRGNVNIDQRESDKGNKRLSGLAKEVQIAGNALQKVKLLHELIPERDSLDGGLVRGGYTNGGKLLQESEIFAGRATALENVNTLQGRHFQVDKSGLTLGSLGETTRTALGMHYDRNNRELNHSETRIHGHDAGIASQTHTAQTSLAHGHGSHSYTRQEVENDIGLESSPLRPNTAESHLSLLERPDTGHSSTRHDLHPYDAYDTSNTSYNSNSYDSYHSLHHDTHAADADCSNEDCSDDYAAGDRTIASDSSDEPVPPPQYISRKRRHESPLQMEITPNHTIPHRSTSDMSGIETGTCESLLKISFSASDSTPCPAHPRKRLRFKNGSPEHTPSQTRRRAPILNFGGSRKLLAAEMPLLHKLTDAHADLDHTESLRPSGFSTHMQSTPISQSTPVNSRAPSPGVCFAGDTQTHRNSGWTLDTKAEADEKTERHEETGQHETTEHQQKSNATFDTDDDAIAGFSFVRPRHVYATPKAQIGAAQRLINSYIANKPDWEILGEVRMSAAGIADDEDAHVGDRRINDPYSVAPPLPDTSSAEVRRRYGAEERLPLLQHFERELSHAEMLAYINDRSSVSEFYDFIFDGSDSRLGFLKRERLRWHPDKWVARMDESIFEKDVVDALSQVINALIAG